MVQRTKAIINGVVQGIGFRPFVYNLAKQNRLCGYIVNTSAGVELEVEGESGPIDIFFDAIINNDLPLAYIASIEKIVLAPNGYQDFIIRDSIQGWERTALIAPDICVCESCLQEMRNPNDRRYRYPFINCTNCGPRYTIIKDVPYDRPFTSMQHFQMCEDCQQEYNDPTNRRFHAQPNACPVCGPQVTLFDARQKRVETNDPISLTAEFLKKGNIVAIKGLGGFHLSVDAENNNAVIMLRQRKYREEKPLALMSLNLNQIRCYAILSDEETTLLSSPQRPIVILQKKMPNKIAPEVAPQNNYVGVMLPYTPLHYLLLDGDFLALVMTSGNLSDEPIVIDNDDAFHRLGNVADYFLIHNRDIYLRVDDSIVRRVNRQNIITRRARGYIPLPIIQKKDLPPILAVGAELKNAVCLTKGKHAIVSQHIGDLKTKESYNSFLMTIDHLQKILDIQPAMIAYDLHPNYLSTQYAQEHRCPEKIGVQHHHAHIASCMAEHGIDGPVLGLAFDGTGYGTDGKIWGGEILLVEGACFSRLAHIDYVPLPGNDAAIKESWRMALSYLFHAYDEDLWQLDLPLFQQLEKSKIRIIIDQMKKKINCAETSSLGRLFDGISAILGICYRSTYEGQAAMMLEMVADENSSKCPYAFEWIKKNEIYLISPKPIIQGVVNDYLNGTAVEIISYKFHLTLIQLVRELCQRLYQDTGLDRIVFSGGVFQNALLLTGLQKALIEDKLHVFTHSKVPTNDGGISLGQAAIAARTVK